MVRRNADIILHTLDTHTDSTGITIVWQVLCGDDYQLSRLGVSGKLVGRGYGAWKRWWVSWWKRLVE